jgi:hypothetical protein
MIFFIVDFCASMEMINTLWLFPESGSKLEQAGMVVQNLYIISRLCFELNFCNSLAMP